jgi:hypothetical protein
MRRKKKKRHPSLLSQKQKRKQKETPAPNKRLFNFFSPLPLSVCSFLRPHTYGVIHNAKNKQQSPKTLQPQQAFAPLATTTTTTTTTTQPAPPAPPRLRLSLAVPPFSLFPPFSP